MTTCYRDEADDAEHTSFTHLATAIASVVKVNLR